MKRALVAVVWTFSVIATIGTTVWTQHRLMTADVGNNAEITTVGCVGIVAITILCIAAFISNNDIGGTY